MMNDNESGNGEENINDRFEWDCGYRFGRWR